MSTLNAYIANFIGSGREITWRDDGRFVRDKLSLNSGGFELSLIQNEEIILGKKSNLQNQFVESTKIEVSDVNQDNVENALKVVDNICWLLSFISQSRVVRYGYEYPAGSNQTFFSSVIGSTVFFRPVIEILNGEQTVDFIEQCYDQYVELEQRRELSVVFDYLHVAELSNQPNELKLIITFTILENLKDTYARDRGIPYKNGYFRKRPKPPKGGGRDSYSFGELLDMMFRSVGMRKGLKRVLELRNEIIHSGISRKSHSWQYSMYEHVQSLIREYILRLLEFNGEYFCYKNGGRGLEHLR